MSLRGMRPLALCLLEFIQSSSSLVQVAILKGYAKVLFCHFKECKIKLFISDLKTLFVKVRLF